LVIFRVVPLKMLPFDNKNEFQVVIDLPEGSTLQQTQALTRSIVSELKKHPEIISMQTYAGTSGPITFNGLVRHYDLRRLPHQADIQVQLTDKHNRSIQSHQIAKEIRPSLQALGKAYSANIKIVEVPPGPPVMSTLVAEIYGPNTDQRIMIAKQVAEVLKKTEGVVDVDVQIEEEEYEYQFVIDRQKASLQGISAAQVVQTLSVALGGQSVAAISSKTDREPTLIHIQLPEKDRTQTKDLERLHVANSKGQ
jgi:multidrug efflux pump subunit AcrB